MHGIREFTDYDWQAWSGAEEFGFIYEKDGVFETTELTLTVIADAMGIGIDVITDSPDRTDEMQWHMKALNNRKAQRELMASIVEEISTEHKTIEELIDAIDEIDGFGRL